MEQTIWIARHGNRADFVNPSWMAKAKRFYDPPLSPDGITQAQNLGRYLKDKGIAHIFASPFRRTVETAHYVAETLNLPIKLEAGLSEFLSPLTMPSTAAKLPVQELVPDFPRIDLTYSSRGAVQYPELTWHPVQQRVDKTIQQLLAEFLGTLLLVGHVRPIVCATQGLTKNNSPINASTLCCLFKLTRTNSTWVLQPHDYIPNPLSKSASYSIAYLNQQVRQRFKSLWD